MLFTLGLLKSWTRYCLVDRSSLAGDVKPAPWDFNLHSSCVQTTEEEKVPKEDILQNAAGMFPNFPPLFATFMLTAGVSLIQTTQAINTPTNPSPLARTLRPIYSAVDYIANSSSHFLPI